ncbi:MAG: beta-ketoacyl-ACP synthase II [Proteobacteria bacterium]|nr:beta-ketoacyl-ACP synthase II [Pseudomonadota bacterium]
MQNRRVVITGVGLITPMGNDVESSWKAILAGQSGIGPIDTFDVTKYSVKFGGLIKDFDATDYINCKDVKKMDPFIHYGIAAADQAILDSGLEVTEENSTQIGVLIGSGVGGIKSIENQALILEKSGPRRITPFFVPMTIINMISGNVSIKYGFKGPNLSIVSACATGVHSIGDSARMIQYGDANVMIAGGAEHCATPLGLAGFAAARALSTRNDDPSAASRPWDADRDGFVLSDGAGVVVLEEYEHAKARDAHIYAEIIGYGMSGDAYHMTLPSQGGEGAARCMNNAIRNARIKKEQVGYVNAHGTSTLAGDRGESDAVKTAFGDHAYKLAISSTKSMTGHALGAAGAIETIFTALALRDQILPPTINFDNPGEGCDLDYVANEARDSNFDVALNNSFGFGGTNGSLILRKL